jgi:hypothetical protein
MAAENLYRLLADNSMHLVCLHDLEHDFSVPSIKKVVGYILKNLIKNSMDCSSRGYRRILTDFANLLVNYLPIRIEYR